MLIGIMFTSCSYDYNKTIYQNKNLRKFESKKRTKFHGHKYIRPGKRGYIRDNTNTKETRRTIIRRINADRWTVDSY